MTSASLVVVMALALLVNACGKKDKPSAARSRFDAVLEDTSKKRPLAELCDVRMPRETAPTFAWPSLASSASSPSDSPAPEHGQARAWRWVNVWATWCKPCLEELPLLHSWQKQLSESGSGVSLQMEYLSVDAQEADVVNFLRTHPEVTSNRRISDPAQLGGFLKQVGLDEHATIPVHIWLNPEGQVRCVRSGSVSRDDLELVRQVLREG